MRFLLGLITLLLVPVFVVGHWRFYQRMMKPSLEVSLTKKLHEDPTLALVEARIDLLDVILDGKVPDLAARDRALATVRKITMLRLRPGDDHLEVPASLESEFSGEHISLSGLLHDQGAVQDVVDWLKESRPSLEIDTSQVQISPYATREPFKERDPLPDMLRPIWTQISVPASLKITRQEHQFAVNGYLPSPEWVQKVGAALRLADPQAHVDSGAIKTGRYVRTESFLQPKELPAFLRAYFSLSDSTTFEATQSLVQFSANVTETMYKQWKGLVDKLVTGGVQLQANWHLYPSLYHLPSYQVTSQLPPETIAKLQEQLAQLHIAFVFGTVSLPSSEENKLKEAAQDIMAAGPNARIVVGAYYERLGDEKASVAQARKRSEAVVSGLTERGVPSARLEHAVFYFPPGVKPPHDEERMVELRLK